jgi:hypothetical protein
MSIDFVTSRKDIPFNELVPRLAPFGITEIKKRSLLRHAVGVRQARPGAVDHLARFRFAAPVAGRSGLRAETNRGRQQAGGGGSRRLHLLGLRSGSLSA